MFVSKYDYQHSLAFSYIRKSEKGNTVFQSFFEIF